MIRNFLKEVQALNLVDIGSSGSLDAKWQPLNSSINLIGFDPNAEECERMSKLPHPFKSVQYLPFAIGGSKGTHTLYKTKSIYCYSLLQPNTEWLRRFSFHDLFEQTGEEPMKTEVLDDIPAVGKMDVDILKCDTQGLELPILKSASQTLHKAFYVETETGFVENYKGETTYSQIDEFMRQEGFLLFDINTSHRITRDNVFRKQKGIPAQLMWCEAVWLKDYIQQARRDTAFTRVLTREKLLKSLIICALQGCIDYGYEIATLGFELKLISAEELNKLSVADAWQFGGGETPRGVAHRLVNYSLRLLPIGMRKIFHEEASRAVKQNHLLKLR
jgi:FkbM family methyltransferase